MPFWMCPSLFTYNGLVFSPDTDDADDIASGTFLEANNAMAAWQNSLSPPPNRTPLNAIALKSRSVSDLCPGLMMAWGFCLRIAMINPLLPLPGGD